MGDEKRAETQYRPGGWIKPGFSRVFIPIDECIVKWPQGSNIPICRRDDLKHIERNHAAVSSLRQMRDTRRCSPPGHIWRGGTLEPGDPCQCGEAGYEPVDFSCPDGRTA